MKTGLLFAWAILTWIAYSILTLPLNVLGLLLIPFCIWFGHTETSYITNVPIFTAPRALWLWGDDEDGYDPVVWQQANPTWGCFKRMYVWGALRNSVNNLRFVKWLNPPPVPAKIKSIVTPTWWLCGQGILFGWQYTGQDYIYSAGWKYNPSDALDIKIGWRKYGVGFGLRRQAIL